MNAKEWVDGFARRIGSDPPDASEIEAILDLAATAAHSSERTAAPVACWLAGQSGRPLDELKAVAEEIGGDQA